MPIDERGGCAACNTYGVSCEGRSCDAVHCPRYWLTGLEQLATLGNKYHAKRPQTATTAPPKQWLVRFQHETTVRRFLPPRPWVSDRYAHATRKVAGRYEGDYSAISALQSLHRFCSQPSDSLHHHCATTAHSHHAPRTTDHAAEPAEVPSKGTEQLPESACE